MQCVVQPSEPFGTSKCKSVLPNNPKTMKLIMVIGLIFFVPSNLAIKRRLSSLREACGQEETTCSWGCCEYGSNWICCSDGRYCAPEEEDCLSYQENSPTVVVKSLIVHVQVVQDPLSILAIIFDLLKVVLLLIYLLQ